MDQIIDMDGYDLTDGADVLRLGSTLVNACTTALTESAVTYIYIEGAVVACIAPPEAGERYEHTEKVLAPPQAHADAVPVLVRTVGPRRRFLGL